MVAKSIATIYTNIHKPTDYWLRNTTETDFMIRGYHVSADGQFDNDASVPAGAVNSERLSEGENMCHCITLCSCTGVTGQMMSDVLFFVSCIEIILCMFAVIHILMFLVKFFSDFSSRYC